MTRIETLMAVGYGLLMLTLFALSVENKLKRIIELLERNQR